MEHVFGFLVAAALEGAARLARLLRAAGVARLWRPARRPLPVHVAPLAKVPRHVAVVLDEGERAGPDDVARLAAALHARGVRELTVHVADDVARLAAACRARGVGDGGACRTCAVPCDPGRLLVRFTDGRRKGKQRLVRVAAELAATVSSPGEVTVARVAEHMGDDEPELLIACGPVLRLHGYDPWHVRLTEIYHCQDAAPDEHNVEAALHQYAHCQQRFGR